MPTVLATLGPAVAETSLLSAHRPLLSLLVSMGAPAIWPTRVFEYNDPAKVLERENRLVLSRLNPYLAVVLSTLQYLLATGAVANIFTTSIQLGQNAILTWGCTNELYAASSM
jgi:hypothetical protein